MIKHRILQPLAALALAGLAACADQPSSYDGSAALYGGYGYGYGYCGSYFCPAYDPFWGLYDPFWGPYYSSYYYFGYPYAPYRPSFPTRPGPWPNPNPPLHAGFPAPRPPFNPPPGQGPVFHTFGPPRPGLGGAPAHAPAMAARHGSSISRGRSR